MKLCSITLLAVTVFAGPVVSAQAAFFLGADISWVQQQEDEGTHFSDHGVRQDIFTILKANKFNSIRLRIFNNPNAEKGYSRKGYCDLGHTLQMAKRIKAAGIGFLLDFHYSDTWADPQHQIKPSAWKDLHGKELENAVHDYTKELLAKMKKQGTPPAMVQIGNEISSGFLWPDGQVWKTKNWGTFCGLIKAGIAGAKEADPSVKIMLHLACGGQNAQSRLFLDNVLAQGVDFDIIGESYYPRWHGTLDELKANLADLAGRYKEDIIVAEYAAPHLRRSTTSCMESLVERVSARSIGNQREADLVAQAYLSGAERPSQKSRSTQS